MTKVHGFVICFIFTIVAVCGFSAHCSPNMSKLGDLALVAIGAVSGNAMNEHLKARRTKKDGEIAK